ncbi:hypothetical protein BN85400760 [Alteracholeplasma palmae J233]|uniref:Uncharacterized protein n=1 Tax=Alteracholeplasma palmae (strain ATCC 49389 / J233) TaxID=1318466 RepID=U4KJQ9_ALTPJ|nr:hypothetical protein [Alteracholeplasma palmae]CCV63653.1 hypothetical protein BN85400760 [Alteracholeplasma palmae J233]
MIKGAKAEWVFLLLITFLDVNMAIMANVWWGYLLLGIEVFSLIIAIVLYLIQYIDKEKFSTFLTVVVLQSVLTFCTLGIFIVIQQ